MSEGPAQTGPSNAWVGWLLLGVISTVVAVIAATLVVTRIQCGEPARFTDPGRMASFVWTGQPGRLAETAGGCTATAPALWWTLGVLLLLVIAALIGLWVAWLRWKQSDLYFLRDVRDRENIARRSEVRRFHGGRMVRRAGKSIRPSVKRPKAQDAGLLLGSSRGSNVWATMEDSICLWGPPRSGKGLHFVIDAILDAPGPVITTSTRTDNYAATKEARAEKGPVVLFDPQGLAGSQRTKKWSPTSGCEDQRTADARAKSLIEATGLGGSNNAEWSSSAVRNVASLLHAAALDGARMDELFKWSSNPDAAFRAVEILEARPGSDSAVWGTQLRGVLEGDTKMRSNLWFGVSNALSALAVPEYRAAMDPTPGSDEELDVEELLDSCGTLYILGSPQGGSTMGVFLVALLDAITETAQRKAATKPSNRLDPPATLVLDEIANLAATWPNLKTIMSAGGGSGIVAFVFFQSGSQARTQWGQDEAEAIFDTATVAVLLGGLKNATDLKKVSDLIGERWIRTSTRTTTEQGQSHGENAQKVPTLRVDELRRLPFGHAIILRDRRRAVLARMRRWTQRRDAKMIRAALASYDESLLTQLTGGQAEVTADPTPAAAVSEPDAPGAVNVDAGTVTDPTAEVSDDQTRDDSWLLR